MRFNTIKKIMIMKPVNIELYESVSNIVNRFLWYRDPVDISYLKQHLS